MKTRSGGDKKTLPRNRGGFNCGWEWCNVVGVLFPQLRQLWEREGSHRVNSLENKSKNAKSETEVSDNSDQSWEDIRVL